ncbi:G2E3 ligase, partial [Upupa epops]|nr:G2E3 ligase [Upupa epops]
PACILCNRADDNSNLYGPKIISGSICAHQFCLVFASDLCYKEIQIEDENMYMVSDILHAVQQAAQKECFKCGEKGASIACQEVNCNRRFHFPCALEGSCITQYFEPFRSFCWEHCPEQYMEAVPDDNPCLICMDPVEDSVSYGTMVCPVCQHAWF